MGSACSQPICTTDLEKRQMVQLFRGLRGYGRTRYVQKTCSIHSELSFCEDKKCTLRELNPNLSIGSAQY